MYRITLTAPWELDFTGVFSPILAHGYELWTELSVKPPTEYVSYPNVGMVLATVTQAQLDAYTADPNYDIIWAEEIIEETI